MRENGIEEEMDWSIQQVAKLAGTTSRTLRHYADLGLLPPSRTGANGYRYYDAPTLARLQRILLLRDLGLGLPAIADVLAGQDDTATALATHLEWLRSEKNRLDRQIGSVETTIRKLKGGEQPMAEEMLDGFDHTAYKQEVESRWGADAYAAGDTWWRSMSADERDAWKQRLQTLNADWTDAAARGLAPDSDAAQALAARHYAWLRDNPGTPRDGSGPAPDYVRGLGDMYVTDERFAANYGGVAGAMLVRDALALWLDSNVH